MAFKALQPVDKPVQKRRTPARKQKVKAAKPQDRATKPKKVAQKATAAPSQRARIEVKAPEPVQIPWRPYQRRFISDPSRRRLWVKSAQIGGSTALASWSLGRCIERHNHLVSISSRSEPQAKELALKIRRFCTEIARIDSTATSGFFGKTEQLEHSIRFPNGSRIIVISSNPETARSYTGDVILDEFAHHPNQAEMFTAVYRQVTLGDYTLLITSTPNGQTGYFYQQAHELGLDLGGPPTAQPTQKGTWTGHWTNIHLAVAEGLQVDVAEIRAGCDALTWSQEYECAFLSESEMWMSPALIEANISADANVGPPALYRSNLYAGWDVARSQNKSAIWFDEILGDVSVCRGLVNLTGLTTPDQLSQARLWMPQVARMNIDKTGMGMVIAETLEAEYPTKCAGVLFTAPTKEAMAVQMRMRLEQRKKRMPDDQAVRRAFLSLRRSVNKIGQARFDAENDDRWGHADEFWAAALAEMAAEMQIVASNNRAQSNIRFDSAAKSPFSHFTTRVL